MSYNSMVGIHPNYLWNRQQIIIIFSISVVDSGFAGCFVVDGYASKRWDDIMMTTTVIDSESWWMIRIIVVLFNVGWIRWYTYRTWYCSIFTLSGLIGPIDFIVSKNAIDLFQLMRSSHKAYAHSTSFILHKGFAPSDGNMFFTWLKDTTLWVEEFWQSFWFSKKGDLLHWKK